MKKLWKILVGILVVLAIVAVVLELSLDKVVLKATNAAGPQLLGVPVSLAKADISLFRGKAALGGLHVGNLRASRPTACWTWAPWQCGWITSRC